MKRMNAFIVVLLAIGFFVYFILFSAITKTKHGNVSLTLPKKMFLTESEDTRIMEPISPAVKTSLKRHLETALRKAKQKTYNILMWDTPLRKSYWKIDESAECGSCKTTYNQSLVNHPDTKAVVFHYKVLTTTTLPKIRRKDQYYVWYTKESPSTLWKRGFQFFGYDDIFNLTMTHRRDSDIFSFYSHAALTLKETWVSKFYNTNQTIDDLIARKSKLAIWIVSNCNFTVGAKLRMAYVDKLVKAGLSLERRGRCFPQSEFTEIKEITEYKFYLAFENSWHCKDYITEKLFRNALVIGGAVPVVFGAKKSDYEALVPPGSCIYAEDFKSPKLLVDYLNYLDKNETAYRSYMKWRTMGKDEMPMSEIAFGHCQLCRVLHGINIDNIYNRNFSKLRSSIPLFGYPNKSRVVPSLRDWFYGQDYNDCLFLS